MHYLEDISIDMHFIYKILINIEILYQILGPGMVLTQMPRRVNFRICKINSHG